MADENGGSLEMGPQGASVKPSCLLAFCIALLNTFGLMWLMSRCI